MKFTVRDPNKAYRGSFLWLPRDSVSEDKLNQDLRLISKGYRPGSSQVYMLWENCGPHVRVPRAYEVPTGMEVVDLTPKSYQTLLVDDLVHSFLDEGQERAYNALAAAREGILHLACGRGKTVLGVKKAVNEGGPFLIVVCDTGTFSQWESAVRDYSTYQDKIGIIRGTKMVIRPITFASSRTLVERPLLPTDVRAYFKTILFDEVHHFAAAQLKSTLPMFTGNRIGLTASIERDDNLEPIIYAHIGPIFHSDMSQPLTPEIYFKATKVVVPISHPELKDKAQQVNMSKMISYLSRMEDRNSEILELVEKARGKDRKVLVLVHNVSHAQALSLSYNDLFPGESAALTGDVNADERRQVLRENPVVFATLAVGKEALDAPDLDTVVFGTPFKNWTTLQQGMGRALRKRSGKKQPVVVILNDVGVIPAAKMCRRLQTELTRRGYVWTRRR